MDAYLLIFLCTVSIAIIGGIGAFLMQLFLSRDKELHQRAHLQALEKESEILEKLRAQQESSQRFSAHYEVLGKNKEAIKELDDKINALFEKKLEMIKMYAGVIEKESTSIIKDLHPFSHAKTPTSVRENFSQAFQSFDEELRSLQAHRAKLWDIRSDFQKDLLSDEKSRNKKLDELYHRHTALFEKVYLSHVQHSEEIDKASIEAGKQAFKYSIFSPARFFEFFFGSHKHMDFVEKTANETLSREMVREAEARINTGHGLNLGEKTILPVVPY